ncbi:SPOR domain-containing protein [Aquidulcibacter sp.]|uniref:SPOR domain-containing protein n=1 Tax=Aquidulcibacter sp. TaxID=2052990 RepID=UPI0025C23070|nr:SPOR domain-containing protein [Aquidulcibacter sp.]MCA3691742.1 SPOR domain-containing protein [Aquidulcibacter sp.]
MANRDRDSFDDYDTDDQDDGFLTFDAREEEEDRSRGPLIIVGIVAVLALIGVVFWQVYSSNREPSETPQVAADTGSFKAPGDAAATAPVVGSDLDKGVFDAASGASAPALDVQPASPVEAPMLTDGSAAPAAVAPAPAPAAAPAKTAPPKQVAAATPAPKPAATAPATKPAAAPAATKTTPVVTKSAAPAPAKASAPAAPKVEPAPAAGTGFAAQLGSFKDKASADTALARFRASGLSGPVSIVAADLGAKGTWYRIRATGFESRSEVEVFCGKARSAGAQCIPASR